LPKKAPTKQTDQDIYNKNKESQNCVLLDGSLERQLAHKKPVPLISKGSVLEQIEGENHRYTRMWANAQRDGRPVEHRWRPLFNAAKFD